MIPMRTHNYCYFTRINPYPANFFSPEMSSAYLVCCIYSNALQALVANKMNPDQTAPKGSSLIWVHIFCNICYQTTSADEKADDICREWRDKDGPVSSMAMHFDNLLSIVEIIVTAQL